jgi:hypothetical protein
MGPELENMNWPRRLVIEPVIQLLRMLVPDEPADGGIVFPFPPEIGV